MTTREQMGPAMALVELVQSHPELPVLEWRIHPTSGTLTGDLYASDHPCMTLHAYAVVLGGRPEPDESATFESSGLVRRMYRLTATWHDVQVQVSASVTIGLTGPRWAEGLAAEWRHQLSDPAEPPLPGALRPTVQVEVAA
ncbi:hypothetical protein [Streptomyces sp. NPDC006784]|uniref:hypothetical protein n=1 Tax=Streptomyces sp. NPDC006784 TaxID=3364764 RepID=UPI00368699E3